MRSMQTAGRTIAFSAFTVAISLAALLVFPLPFLQLAGYEAGAAVLQPVLIATAIMTIPFVFMLIAWQKRAPKEN